MAEYKAWWAAHARCSDPRDAGYSNYGGRGISVCDSWRDFWTFFADMGPRPSSKHSLERIDNNRGYSPDNCKWATKAEQCNNIRRNVRLHFNGETKTLMQWSIVTGINYQTLRKRRRNGWHVAEMLTIPVDERFSTK